MVKDFICKLKFIFIPCDSNKWKPRFLNSKFLFYYPVCLLLLKLLIIPFLYYFPETSFFADVTQVSLVQLTNIARQQLGYPVLKENEALNYAAKLKAQDMINRGYFAHYSPEGISPWYWLERAGYVYQAAGENLAIGFLESDQVHQAWMKSLSHRNNILNQNYQEIGIAVIKGSFQGKETTLVVQLLGTQRILVPQEKPAELLISQKEEVEIPIIPVLEQVIGEETEKKELVIKEEETKEEEVLKELKESDSFEESEKETEEPKEAFEEERPLIAVLEEEGKIKATPAISLFQFMMSDYYKWIQRIIYFSLFLILLLLFATFYCDVFIYRKFKIDYKDVVFKTVGFSALWFVLIYLDKLIIVEVISQGFRIF